MKITLHTSALICAITLLGTPAHADLLNSAKGMLNSGSGTAATSTAPVSGDLLGMVTSGLGISDQQASGGLGALFKTAQGQLSSDDFGTIAKAVPNMDQLLGAAPQAESNSATDGLLSKAGSLGKSLGGADYLNSAFSKLGLSPDMIGPMANIATQYLQGTSPEAAALLKQVTGGLM